MSDTEPVNVQQQVIERGDRQLPDEPNRGFKIIRLEREEIAPPISPKDAFPLSYQHLESDETALNKLIADDLIQRLVSGQNSLKFVDKGSSGFRLKVDYPIKSTTYEAAVTAGIIEADLFDAKGNMLGTDPRPETLAELVEATSKKAALEATVMNDANSVRITCYQDDLGNLPEHNLSTRERNDLTKLLEAYELNDGGNTIRIMNFSGTRLTEEQLRQGVNAVRSAADKSGGGVYNGLSTIVILPEEHSLMKVKVKDEEGEFELSTNGVRRSQVLALSERTIQRPEDRKPRTERERKYFDKFFGKFRLPEEPTEGPGSPKASVSMGDWEAVLAHELEHIALPDDKRNTVPLPGPAPTQYGRSSRSEHIAELAAAEYMGGEDALAIPEEQRQAKQEMWQQHRGSKDGGLNYKQPLGPHFITCTELDVTNGPLPLRLRKLFQAIPAEITYHLEQTASNI